MESVALIARYVGAGYQSANSSLRRAGIEPGFEVPDQVARTVDAFRQFAQPIDAGTVTYRGITDQVIELGDLYNDAALVSSSQSGLVGSTIHGREYTIGTFLEIRWPGDVPATIINSMELEYVTTPDIVYKVVARYENVYVPSEHIRITRYYVVVPEFDPTYRPPPAAPPLPSEGSESAIDILLKQLKSALALYEDFPEPDQADVLLNLLGQAEGFAMNLPADFSELAKLAELEEVGDQAMKALDDLG